MFYEIFPFAFLMNKSPFGDNVQVFIAIGFLVLADDAKNNSSPLFEFLYPTRGSNEVDL